jgi:hypothetical protein
VNPVPDPLFLRKSGSTGNRTQASGSVARDSDHWTREVVPSDRLNTENNSTYLRLSVTIFSMGTNGCLLVGT